MSSGTLQGRQMGRLMDSWHVSCQPAPTVSTSGGCCCSRPRRYKALGRNPGCKCKGTDGSCRAVVLATRASHSSLESVLLASDGERAGTVFRLLRGGRALHLYAVRYNAKNCCCVMCTTAFCEALCSFDSRKASPALSNRVEDAGLAPASLMRRVVRFWHTTEGNRLRFLRHTRSTFYGRENYCEWGRSSAHKEGRRCLAVKHVSIAALAEGVAIQATKVR
eukprot:5862134-Prymnesium_polylepis.1